MSEIGPAADDEGLGGAQQLNMNPAVEENVARAGQEQENVDPGIRAHALNLEPEVDVLNPNNIPNLITFTIAELKAYTNEFDEGNKVGQGNHRVYRGIITGGHKRLNGKAIAVKMYRRTDEEIPQWEAEITYLPTLKHKNIIKLLGKCETSTRLYLVYPFMRNGSVQERVTNLDWRATIKILRGSTSALNELHKHDLVYRDFKPANILLDKDLNPILSDFGLVAKVNTYCCAGGTVGFTESRAMRGEGTEARKEFDVYSLGIVIFQLLMKRRDVVDPNEGFFGGHITQWARQESHQKDLVHADLKSSGYTSAAALKLTLMASRCTIEPPEARPTIRHVLQTFSEIDTPEVIKCLCLPCQICWPHICNM